MDIGCKCVCDVSGEGESPSCIEERIRTAQKEYECCECREEIKKGEKYEFVRGMWCGSWSTYRTCLTCVSIRNDVCCGCWQYTALREVIWKEFGIDYVTGEENESLEDGEE